MKKTKDLEEFKYKEDFFYMCRGEQKEAEQPEEETEQYQRVNGWMCSTVLLLMILVSDIIFSILR